VIKNKGTAILNVELMEKSGAVKIALCEIARFLEKILHHFNSFFQFTSENLINRKIAIVNFGLKN